MYPKVEERHPRPDAVTFTGVPIVLPNRRMGSWTTGLCGCWEDFTNCCITCWCPCVAFGQNAEIIDRGNTWDSTQSGGQCADFCIHFWCPFCAVCQEHRELVNRGLDPSIGWVANEEMQNRQIGMTVPPAPQQGMTRA
ncbi:hypothetical protein MLD38_037633 [Melastoma candidum]|uniref:Uncharacterized protein n=1 Tax=Melastoma candidum TaxID=119954 RepID=A0ACB9LP17_9MYRT|nr:hypothetical protein MLD38_037633 [Melastoma candidum]